MRRKPTRKRPYFTMESSTTAILRDASGKMHHGILFVVWSQKKIVGTLPSNAVFFLLLARLLVLAMLFSAVSSPNRGGQQESKVSKQFRLRL